MILGNSLHDQLRLQSPVSIYGPFPLLMRIVDVGDLIQLQLSAVPGPGPMPVSVRVLSDHGRVSFVEAVLTGTAVYHPNPGETVSGLIGTTNYSVFVKAIRPGPENISVEVILSDGSRKKVPFAFTIS